MSSDEGAAEGGQARTTAPTEGALAVASDDTASGAEPQQLPAAPPGASAGRPTGGEKGSMAERDRVWASASALERAGADLVRCACLPWWGVACLSGRSVGCLPRHGLLPVARRGLFVGAGRGLFAAVQHGLFVGARGGLLPVAGGGLFAAAWRGLLPVAGSVL